MHDLPHPSHTLVYLQLCENAGLNRDGRPRCKAIEYTSKRGGAHAGKCELHFRRANADPDSKPTACQHARCLVNKGPKFQNNNGNDLGKFSVNEGATLSGCASGNYILYAPRSLEAGGSPSTFTDKPSDADALALGYVLRQSDGTDTSCTNENIGDPAVGYLKQCTCYDQGVKVELKNDKTGCCRFRDADDYGCNPLDDDDIPWS